MASLSFVDFVFPQFPPANWQAGVGVFHAGGVHDLQVYGELVSARVRAGIGENYEVRMKLHAQGKAVQWMECTCQAYRRRNEKCPHLAAFCIHLDQERPDVLARNGLGSGGSDRYMRFTLSSSEAKAEAGSGGAGGADVRTGDGAGGGGSASAGGSASGLVGGGATIESLITSRLPSVKQITLSDEEGALKVVVLGESGKRIAYQLRVDDALRLLRNPSFEELLPKKLREPHGLTAKRYFDVRKLGRAGVRIVRGFALLDGEGEEARSYALEDHPDAFVGREGVFVKRAGFVPFSDAMAPAQLFRWEEYPKTASLDGDTAAALFQSGFARLRETAEVRIADELAKLQVLPALEIPELRLKAAGDGHFFVEPTFKGLGAEGRVLDAVEGGPQAGAAQAGAAAAGNVLLALLRARQEGRQYLQTKQGWVRIGEGLDWLQGRVTADGRLKLTALELIKFREQVASESEITGQGDVVGRIRAGLVPAARLEMPDISHTQLRLRGYQEEGVRWLWWLHANGLGGLLADEMGLGKTHQAMGLIAGLARRTKGKMSLVVCPTSVLDHWIDKLRTFVPDLDAVCYHGTQRRPDLLRPGNDHQVIVTSYGILLRDVNILAQMPWSVVILDEAHLVKNQTTRTYRAACKIKSDMRLCLTGTPLENDLMELKNLFDFIAPGYLGSDADFKRKYMAAQGPKDALADVELQRLIHPFKLRRNKKEVLTELPDKVEDMRHCHLNEEQYQLYTEALALRGRALVETLSASNEPVPYVHIFSVISLLKQICDDPGLVDPRYEDVGSGKLQLFDELMLEALESGQKVVVFSQYAKMVARLSARLTRQGVRHVTLTGSTTHRGAVVREFQENDDVKVFVGSLLAGGTGIDLTSASVVIHFDRWWNAAKENQATDRIHRIGQHRAVQVYKLVTKGTLEERIDEIINRKRMLFDRFVEQDDELFKTLSREDLLELLAPPETYQAIDAVERESLALAASEAITVETL